MRQLVYLAFGDSNLLSFHLWWTEIVLKCEKVYNFFPIIIGATNVSGCYDLVWLEYIAPRHICTSTKLCIKSRYILQWFPKQ